MMEYNNIIKNGTVVTILDSTFKATVIGVCIRGIGQVNVEYEVQWVDSSGINSKWVFGYVVKEFVDTRQPAGMVNYNTDIQIL